MAERPKVTQLPGAVEKTVMVETIALGTANEVVLWKNDTGAKATVTAFQYVPEAAVTGVGTNNMSLQILNKGSVGTGSRAVTDIKTFIAGVDMVAFKGDSLVLAGTAASLDVADGEVLSLDKAENGTGLALPAGIGSLKIKFSN